MSFLIPQFASAALVLGGCTAGAPPSSSPPASRPIPPPASQPAPAKVRTAPGADAAVVALLDDLEASGRTLEAFTATVFYETEDSFLGNQGRVIRKGDLIYHVDPSARGKSFAIRFDTMIEGNRKIVREKEYIFRDGWLVERDRAARQFVKRQIVRPGEDFDPLKLGEGPIPLPIGQPRDQVLRRFEVALIALPAQGPLARLRGVVEVDGLRLVPRPGRPEADEYTRIDLFYDRVTRLPVGIEVIEKNGDRKTARLGDLARNPELDEAALARIDIAVPEDAAEWHVDVRPLE